MRLCPGGCGQWEEECMCFLMEQIFERYPDPPEPTIEEMCGAYSGHTPAEDPGGDDEFCYCRTVRNPAYDRWESDGGSIGA